MQTTRRLYLPGGGSFDIKLDDVIATAPLEGPDFAASAESPPWLAIAGGAALGGALTWLLVKVTKSW